MSELSVRPAVATDIKALMEIDHASISEYVWQMDLQKHSDQVSVSFREVRLPRPVNLAYPRNPARLAEEWNHSDGFLTAVSGDVLAGYLRIRSNVQPLTGWITDLAVAPRFRRQGVASMLMLEAQRWAGEQKNEQVILEMCSKNYPAVRLAQKLGYEYCGYNDHYYLNRDIALFFRRAVRA